MGTMSNKSDDVLAPKWLVLPSLVQANQSQSNAITPTGSIAISGAELIFYNGTNWKRVTAS